MRRLLDTNVWIDHWKNPSGDVARRLAGYTSSDLVTCSVVRAELLHGAKKYGNPARRTAMVVGALSVLQSLPFDDTAADHFAGVKHDLERRGTPIGPYDLQIAAIALAHDLTVVTGNVREFARVPGLKLEDWTAAGT